METESDFKFMTETLKLTNSNEDVADYIRWIITSDTAKKYWQSAHQNRIAELEKENAELKDKEIRGDRMLVELHHQIAVLKSKSLSVKEEKKPIPLTRTPILNEFFGINPRKERTRSNYLTDCVKKVMQPNLTEIEVSDIIIKMMDEYIFKEEKKDSKWISVEARKPLCLSTGHWDGKRSDFVFCVDKEGECYVANCYEGTIDGSYFFAWYDKMDYEITNIEKWMDIPTYTLPQR